MSETTASTPIALEWHFPRGSTLHGLRWQCGDDRVWLMHEPGADLDAWGSLPALMASRLALDTIAIDLPGHGLSDAPWEPSRLPDLIRFLAEELPAGRRQFAIAAGSVANAVLNLAPELSLAGVVGLSPEAAGDHRPPRSPLVPKLLIAGSLAGDDLRHARRLASVCGGWAVVTSVPVAESGTAMLSARWGEQISEQIVAFLRDCQRR